MSTRRSWSSQAPRPTNSRPYLPASSVLSSSRAAAEYSLTCSARECASDRGDWLLLNAWLGFSDDSLSPDRLPCPPAVWPHRVARAPVGLWHTVKKKF